MSMLTVRGRLQCATHTGSSIACAASTHCSSVLGHIATPPQLSRIQCPLILPCTGTSHPPPHPGPKLPLRSPSRAVRSGSTNCPNSRSVSAISTSSALQGARDFGGQGFRVRQPHATLSCGCLAARQPPSCPLCRPPNLVSCGATHRCRSKACHAMQSSEPRTEQRRRGGQRGQTPPTPPARSGCPAAHLIVCRRASLASSLAVAVR